MKQPFRARTRAPSGERPPLQMADVTVISLTSMSIVFTGICFNGGKGQKHHWIAEVIGLRG